jgi:SWI/SNF-related matrix-associated actin-dependent regulator 1 of chromatin subfamily A
MSGTPIPNRPHEFWTILSTLAPDVIGKVGYWSFINRFCTTRETPFGTEITGARRQGELNARLRGSGFLVRRRKEEVLHELPPKRYKMVAIEPDHLLASILEREAPFDPAEIYARGVPVGSALPEIRHEMGLAKVPAVVGYVRDLLDGGMEKVLVFAYHRDVIASLVEGLSEYGAEPITGSTPPARRQAVVQKFQNNSAPRVIVGQIQAAGEGLTLTAACDVVFAEASYVPGQNDQCADRAHRIGQTRGVVVHHVVVRGSIDAHVLGAAAGKAADLQKVLDGPLSG